MKKNFILIFFSIFFLNSSSLSHVSHYKNIKSLKYGLFLNNQLIGTHIFNFSKANNDVLMVKSEGFFKVEKFGVTAVEIKNFIDEIDYPKIPAKVEGGANFVFVFVGSMTNRKGVLLLLKTFYKLSKVHANLKLHLVGDGPEIYKVRKFVKDTNLSELVIIHGQLDTPLEIVARSDYFVLPSLSEGTSRAAMEALYLGLPCIMRNVDSNSELIQSPEQGFLFDTDEELFALMERAVTDGVSRRNKTRLPIEFSQIECTKSYVNLVQAL